MKMVEVAELVAPEDGRCFLWVRHAVVVAARSVGCYERGKDYSDKEAAIIKREVKKLFPHRGE